MNSAVRIAAVLAAAAVVGVGSQDDQESIYEIVYLQNPTWIQIVGSEVSLSF